MTYPQEYQRATDEFKAFLGDVMSHGSLPTRNVAYTMAQAVLQAFRRRLTLEEAILFAGILPGAVRGFFVADWNPNEPHIAFDAQADMMAEIKSLRPDHNLSQLSENPVADVAFALKACVGEETFERTLKAISDDAVTFWQR